jgi:hypothetical protein
MDVCQGTLSIVDEYCPAMCLMQSNETRRRDGDGRRCPLLHLVGRGVSKVDVELQCRDFPGPKGGAHSLVFFRSLRVSHAEDPSPNSTDTLLTLVICEGGLIL